MAHPRHRAPPDLRGQTALLTGASRGLGVVIAQALAREGVNLALVARTALPLDQLAAELRGSGLRVETVAGDIASAEDRERIVRLAEAKLGAIDILVNNAGVGQGSAFARLPLEQIREVLRVNLEGTLELTRLVLPGMLARRRGCIVTMASLGGKVGYPYASVYGASKAALIAWSRALQVELDGTGVRAVAVTPGFVSDTGRFARLNAQPPSSLGQSTPADVAAGVLKALRGTAGEVIVNPKPVWPMLVLHAVAPEFLLKVMRRRGVFEWMKRVRGGEGGE